MLRKDGKRPVMRDVCGRRGLGAAMLGALIACGAASASSAADKLPPLKIRSQGSFFVGGHDEKSDYLAAPGGFLNPSGTITVDQMYVQYQVPETSRRHTPIVLIHGCCLTGKTWETTPDGRIGWSEYFVREDRPTYVVDQVARGRSGFDPSQINKVAAGKADPDELPVIFSASHEGAWTIFRFGPKFPEKFSNLKFPLGSQNEFWKQMVPDLNRSLPSPNPTLANLSRLAGQLKGAVLVSHSESGPFPFQAAATKAAGIEGIISIEPGSCSGFEGSIKRLAKIPTVVLYGDYVDQFQNWASSLASCRQFVQQLNDAGGDAQVLVLPEVGVRGNSHMLMQDKNNLEIADMLLDWIDKHVERRRGKAG